MSEQSEPIPNKVVKIEIPSKTIHKKLNNLTLDEIHTLMWHQGLKVRTIATDVLLTKYPILKDYIEFQDDLEKNKSNAKKNSEFTSTDDSSSSQFSDDNSTDSIDMNNISHSNKGSDSNIDSSDSDTDDSDTNIASWISINDDIQKQIIEPGIQRLKKPVNGDICTINIMGTFDNGEVMESYFNRKICVGYQEISEGLDLLLKTMYINECIRAKVAKKYLHDYQGKRYDLNSASHILYTVKLLNIERQKKKYYNDLFDYHRIDNKDLIPRNRHSVLDRFFAKSFEKKKLTNSNIKKDWYNEITLEAFIKDPINTYIKIGIAEMVMREYIAAYNTLSYIIEHTPSKLQVIYLRDIIEVIREKRRPQRIRIQRWWDRCEEESDSDCSLYYDSDENGNEDEERNIPLDKYKEIKNLKKMINLENIKKEEASFTSIMIDKIIWVLALGIPTVTITAVIKKYIS